MEAKRLITINFKLINPDSKKEKKKKKLVLILKKLKNFFNLFDYFFSIDF